MNIAFEGVVPSNQTVLAFDHEVPEGEMWRLSLLTVSHSEQHIQEHDELASPPGTLVARLFIVTGSTEQRQIYTFSGDSSFIRQPLYSVLESGDRLLMEITARHHDHACVFEGFVSMERRSITSAGALRVEVVNQSAASHYLHFQPVPAAAWTILHGLGFYPSVTVVDSVGRVVEGDVEYLDPDTAKVTFSAAFSGSAHCS